MGYVVYQGCIEGWTVGEWYNGICSLPGLYRGVDCRRMVQWDMWFYQGCIEGWTVGEWYNGICGLPGLYRGVDCRRMVQWDMWFTRVL